MLDIGESLVDLTVYLTIGGSFDLAEFLKAKILRFCELKDQCKCQSNLLTMLMVVNNLCISYSSGHTFTFFTAFFKCRRSFPFKHLWAP